MPLAMRRTVIWWSSPPLRTRSTVPSNFCRRSRFPSTTRTLTATVSPGRISGTSAFCCSEASVFKTSFIGMVIALTKTLSLSEGLALRLLQAVEDRHMRHTEVLRELTDGEPGGTQTRDVGDGWRPLRATCGAHADAGRAEPRTHGRGRDAEAGRDAV